MASENEYVYKAKLNIQDILSGLVEVDKQTEATAKRIDAAFKKSGKSVNGLFIDMNGRVREANGRFSKMGNEAAKGFSGIEKSAELSGVQIGAISGIVGSLVTEFINLGKQAVGVLVDIGKQSIQTALEMDTLKARLGGIFDGSQEAADQAFNFIQAKSKELGIDLGELAGAFIPKTENLAQFEKVAKIATALARSDPEQGAIGARIAMIEALSGTFTSLQRRFEIPAADIKQLKEAFDTGGMDAFLTKFEEVLGKSGKSFEDLNDTAQTTFSRIGIAGQQLEGTLGEPIVKALKEAGDELLKFLGDNEAELTVFANSIGDAVASIMEFVTNLINLGDITPENIINLGEQIYGLAQALEAAGTLVGRSVGAIGDLIVQFDAVLGIIVPVNKAFMGTNDSLLGWISSLTEGDNVFTKFLDFLAKSEAGLEGLAAMFGVLVDSASLFGQALGAAFTGNIEDAKRLYSESEKLKSTAFSAGQKATREAYAENKKTITDYTKAVSDHKKEQDDLLVTLKDSKNANTDVADSLMESKQAETDAAAAAEKLAEAQEKVDKAMKEAATDLSRKLEDIDTETERKRLDIAIEFAQKREDAAKKHVDAIADIYTKNKQAQEDAAKDLSRSEEDIATKYADERIDQEKEQRQKALDIETDYRRKLQDIQKEFLSDADEAEDARDAVAFLKAIKKRDESVANAQTERSQSIADLQTEGAAKQAELELQRQREIEAAQLANDRKLQDLQTSLEHEIEAQNTAYSREIEDIGVAETRKNEELALSRQRDIEDANEAYARKLEDLQTSLADELKILEEGNAALEEENARHNEAMATTYSTPAYHGESTRTTENKSQGTSSTGRAVGGRATGGSVTGGQSYMVGEAGPELFTPTVSGNITPSTYTMSNLATSSAISNVNNSKNQSINIPMVGAGALADAVFVAKLRNMILGEMAKVA